MSVSLLTPDLRRILDDLGRRIGFLERRTKQTASPTTPVSGYAHAGNGTNSVILEPLLGGAVAGDDGVAIGRNTSALANGIAIGSSIPEDGATAAAEGIAIGHDSTASAGGVAIGGVGASLGAKATVKSVALGAGASAGQDGAVAIGAETTTLAADQVNIGSLRLFAGVPTTAPADANFHVNQVSIWLNESGNLLTFKVKYSSGTTKSGTVALS